MIQFTCTQCHARLSVSDDKAGQSGSCPKCGCMVQVPAAAREREALKPMAGAIGRVEGGEIPLAEELPRASASAPSRRQQPHRVPGRPVVPEALAGEGIERGDIPPTDGSGESGKEASLEPQSTTTPAGLVIAPVGDAIVVAFQKPKILDAMEIEPIGQELYALVDQRACRKIVLDFGNVKFLSSQMLGALMALQKKSAGIKGRVVLCGLSGDLHQLFKIVNLHKVLVIVADRQTALGVVNLPA